MSEKLQNGVKGKGQRKFRNGEIGKLGKNWRGVGVAMMDKIQMPWRKLPSEKFPTWGIHITDVICTFSR